jgi:hypothetical protein
MAEERIKEDVWPAWKYTRNVERKKVEKNVGGRIRRKII